MNTKEKNFYKAQDTFSKKGLLPEQKKLMLAHIYEKVPSDIPINIESDSQSTPSIVSPFFIFFKKNTFKIATVACIFLFTTLTYASAHSLPGDILYKIKVSILEPVIWTTKNTEELKVEYALTLISKRIKELEELSTQGIKNQKSLESSIKVTQRNISVSERLLINNDKKINEFVAKVEAYNAVVGLDLKIETRLKDFLKTKTEETIEVDTLPAHANEKNDRVESVIKTDLKDILPNIDKVEEDKKDEIKNIIQDTDKEILNSAIKETEEYKEVEKKVDSVIKNIEL